MPKGGNGKAQAKGHEQANENFANGYCENGPPNENAAKGLANALEHNPFECSTTIDFDTGNLTILWEYSGSYWYYSYDYMGGTYEEDGYTISFSTYDENYYYGTADIGVPVFDIDGDGDNEFGVNDLGSDGYYYYYDYEYTSATLTQDDGGNFSLLSWDTIYQDDGDYYDYDYLQLWHSDYDATENSYNESGAYTYDAVNWYTWDYSYDYDTGSYTYTNGYTTDQAEVAALFEDISALYFYMYDDMAIDNIEVQDSMVA